MHVISQTRPSSTYHYSALQEHAPCILTHTSVLILLVLSVAISTGCVVTVTAGWDASTSVTLFIVQVMFCVLACPTLTLAVCVPSSVFFLNDSTSTDTSLLTRCVFIVLAIETLLMFWFYV